MINKAISIDTSNNQLVVSAPSNIALIKYMGLVSKEHKIPANSSLSFTLTKKRTEVKISEYEFDQVLVPAGEDRYLNFLKFLKSYFGVKSNLLVESRNNFPLACGLASSASSFAALTAAVAIYSGVECDNKIAYLSRLGSGSACRSFFPTWSEWRPNEVLAPDLPELDLIHKVIIINKNIKAISSSNAHTLVTSSPNFKHRTMNANERLINLKYEIKSGSWQSAGEIIKEEYLEMHNLFETSKSPFSYRNAQCRIVEQWLFEYINSVGLGPWVTLDAGPNIHLLFQNNEQMQHCMQELNKSIPGLEII